MKLKFLPACAVFVLLTSASPSLADTISDCTLLSRNLKFGMVGSDVRALQRLLNLQAATRVSDSGPGSPGNEGIYFGAKTKLAVVHFQELYKSEVLTPVGLSIGNGFVGSRTRQRLTLFCDSRLSSTQPTTPPHISLSTSTDLMIMVTEHTVTTPLSATRISTISIPKEDLRAPYLMFPAAYTMHQGGKVVLKGGGYSLRGNTVHLGDKSWNGVISTANGSLEVALPPDAAKGKFDLWFENSKGVSNKSFVVITDASAVDPVVTSVTPSSGFEGTEVTVTGENFSKTWNEVRVGSGTVGGLVSVDGKTLTFTISLPVPGLSAGQDVAGKEINVPLLLYIINENGVSKRENPGVFTLKI